MRRILIYITIIIGLCFFIPLIVVKKFENEPTSSIVNGNVDEPISESNNYDYKEYNTVKLLHIETGETEEIRDDIILHERILKNREKKQDKEEEE